MGAHYGGDEKKYENQYPFSHVTESGIVNRYKTEEEMKKAIEEEQSADSK